MSTTATPPLESVLDLIRHFKSFEPLLDHVPRRQYSSARLIDLQLLGTDLLRQVIQGVEPGDLHTSNSGAMSVDFNAVAFWALQHPEIRLLLPPPKGEVIPNSVKPDLEQGVQNSKPHRPLSIEDRVDEIRESLLKTKEAERPNDKHRVITPAKSDTKKCSIEEQRTAAIAAVSRKRQSALRHRLVSEVVLRAIDLETQDAQLYKRERWLRLLFREPVRILPPAREAHLQRLAALEQAFPHFALVISAIRDQVRLRVAGAASITLQPLLIVGPPGIGKTAFLEALARCIDHQDERIGIAGTTASWVLKGQAAGWADSGPGSIFKAAVRLPERRGLMVTLDEIDKAFSSYRQYPVEPALLELLEPSQLRRFSDEFMGLELNLLGLCSFMATANSVSPVPDPVRSRFQVMEVGAPSRAQMPAVVRSVDAALRRQHRYLDRLFEPLSQPVIERLSAETPRALQRFLFSLYCRNATMRSVRPRAITELDIARLVACRKQIEVT